jgi:uncharacterized protein (TIGR00369 family)
MLERFHGIIAGEVEPPPVATLVGLRMVEAAAGRVVFELDAGPQHASPLGTVHGGVLCDLADAAMGCAHASLLGEGESFTTLELKINFLKPVWEGRLTAVATVVKAGRTVGLTACDVTDADGSLVAHATSTCLTLRGDMARGR